MDPLFLTRFWDKLKAARKAKDGADLTEDEIARIERETRAYTRGVKREAKKYEQKPPSRDLVKEAVGEAAALQDYWEDARDELQQALQYVYPGAWILKTADDHVIYMFVANSNSWDDAPLDTVYFKVSYTRSGEEIRFGPPERVTVISETRYETASLADDDQTSYTLSEIRLADGQLPTWLQLHKIGTWAIPHADAGVITFTRAMGDQIIDNFDKGVVRRGVPLDEGHATASGGKAIGWFQALRWGSEGQGLPGSAEPDGEGEILYGLVKYTTNGQQSLEDEAYKYISPEYHSNYRDKETGAGPFGTTLLAVAATNEPFLRLRSIQGEPAAEPVLLRDGIRGGSPMVTQQNHAPPAPVTAPAAPPVPAPAAPAAPTSALMDQTISLAEIQRQLADERTAREHLQSALAEQMRQNHLTQVDAWEQQTIKSGVPASVVKLAAAGMRHNLPGAEGAIRLSDSKPEDQALNNYALFKLMAETAGQVAMNVYTVPNLQERPVDDASAQLDERYKAEAAAIAKSLTGVYVGDAAV